MKSVNKVILVGNLGKDPEMRYTPNGIAVAKLVLATSESYRDKSGEWQEQTKWHTIIAWRKLAELAAAHLKKGNKVYVEGCLETRSWDDRKTGEKKYTTEVIASELVFMDGQHQSTTKADRSREADHGRVRAVAASTTSGDNDFPF